MKAHSKLDETWSPIKHIYDTGAQLDCTKAVVYNSVSIIIHTIQTPVYIT